MTSSPTRTFFITGVSSGFGRALADACFAAAHRVIGTVRNDAPASCARSWPRSTRQSPRTRR